MINDQTMEMLRRTGSATLTTCLFKRGLRNQFLQEVYPVNSFSQLMIGEAYTLRYIPAREDLNTLSVYEDPEHPQRRAVEECPPGCVLVMDSRSDARSASAGSILIDRLRIRGVAGVVTDGGFRDTPEIAQIPIPTYHKRPSAPTNLVHHQAIDLQVPVGCGGVPVFPGDVVFGDREGVVIIPTELVEEVAEEAAEMVLFEKFVAEKIREGRSVIGLYPLTNEDVAQEYSSWRNHRSSVIRNG